MNAERILVSRRMLGDARYFIERASSMRRSASCSGGRSGRTRAVQFPIARAYAEWKAADLLTRTAAALFDAGMPCGEEANIAKLLASEAAWHAAEACMQTFGGFAAAREYDIERKWRECRSPDRADLDQPDPRLYRPARARHAEVVLVRDDTFDVVIPAERSERRDPGTPVL